MNRSFNVALVLLTALMMGVSALAATIQPQTTPAKKKSTAKVTETAHAQKRKTALRHSRTQVRTSAARRRYYERFSASSFIAGDQGEGDNVAGEDPVVRAAAIDALGNMNGTVVAIDPNSGRVLAMVNQKLALSEGAQPCSTFKVAVALAALNENVITKETKVNLGGQYKVDLTTALAHSNNAYFEAVGRKLGFEKVSYYAHQFGLGELAGWNIQGEHLGQFPSTELAESLGGVGKMCSFGESISLTPLQLVALIASISNGGTLYYLQHPTSPEEITSFTPRVKRYLDIKPLIPEISDGMSGAVQYGTARSLRTNFYQEPVLGKTGTCSKDGVRLGWFGSFADTEYGRIAVVVFLEGGRPTFGPKAAELAGKFYRNLYDHNFFAVRAPLTPVHAAQRTNGLGAQQ
jgi:cell division protein FtsI/penicillin-binding protein 2